MTIRKLVYHTLVRWYTHCWKVCIMTSSSCARASEQVSMSAVRSGSPGSLKKRSLRWIESSVSAFLLCPTFPKLCVISWTTFKVHYHLNSFQITLTFKLPVFLHGLNFDLEEVKELCGIWHPEHQRSKVRWQFEDVRSAYLAFLLCGTGHIYVMPKLREL